MKPGAQSFAEIGALATLRPQDVLAALSLIKQGRIYDLEVTRFPGMPRASGHPPLQLMTYRSPHGGQAEGMPDWLQGPNPHRVGVVTEMLIGTLHSGTHIDALSHFTIGEKDSWFNDESAGEYLSDFGPLRHDIGTMPPIITRGVMLDIAAALGVEMLPAAYAITPEDCARAQELGQVEVQPRDAVLIRTGYMTGWPDPGALAMGAGAGVGFETAQWLADRGAVVVGTDTPNFEQNPSADPDMPRVVHPFLLIERGIPIIELAFLEDLAQDRISSFALVISPLKIKGGTASMVRPLAIV